MNSEKNSVVFSAGQDIKFEEDFTVHGKGFELKAQGSLIVGDKATVQTKFGKYETGSIESLPQTSIDVKGDVRFGNDATFRTTMLSMNAGDDENHTEGNITFGERASIQTSVLGAVIDAQGDIAFGAGSKHSDPRRSGRLLCPNLFTRPNKFWRKRICYVWNELRHYRQQGHFLG